MMTTILTLGCLFLAHAVLIVLAICRAAKLGDDAMRDAFRAQDKAAK